MPDNVKREMLFFVIYRKKDRENEQGIQIKQEIT